MAMWTRGGGYWDELGDWDWHKHSVLLVTQLCPALCDPMDCSPPGSFVHGDSPGKNTRVDCHALLQGIFPIQGSNPGLSHCRRILYWLSHKGSPIYTLPCVKQTAGGNLLYNDESSAWCSVMSQVGRMWGSGAGKAEREGINVYI